MIPKDEITRRSLEMYDRPPGKFPQAEAEWKKKQEERNKLEILCLRKWRSGASLTHTEELILAPLLDSYEESGGNPYKHRTTSFLYPRKSSEENSSEKTSEPKNEDS